MIHLDNRKMHDSAKITKGLEEFHVARLPHPTFHLATSGFLAGARM
jgi:hypothetical protein